MKTLILTLALSGFAVIALASDDRNSHDSQVVQATLEGSWSVQRMEQNGQSLKDLNDIKLRITREHIFVCMGNSSHEYKYRIDVRHKPNHLDMVQDFDGPGQPPARMIYLLQGDILQVALNPGADWERPTEFKTGPGSNQQVTVLNRDSR